MSTVGGWQYRLRYILDDVELWEENQPEEKIKYIPAGQGSDSTSSIPRRDDFLSRLLSGRKYKISIETVAGSGEDAIISGFGWQKSSPFEKNLFKIVKNHFI